MITFKRTMITFIGDGGHAAACKEIESVYEKCFGRPSWMNGLFIAIGDNKIRKIEAEKYNIEEFGLIISNYGTIGNSGSVGRGTVIMENVIIQAGVNIGNHCIINCGAIIAHHCTIGDFAHIAPGAVLCGNVTVGEGALVGANATCLPGAVIEPWTTVKAGSVVK